MGKQFSGHQKQSQILLFNGNDVCLWLVDHNGEALQHHEDPKQREAGNCCKGPERLSSHLVHRMGVVGLSRKWSNNSVVRSSAFEAQHRGAKQQQVVEGRIPEAYLPEGEDMSDLGGIFPRSQRQ
ncbi:RIP metalloprotease RseP [Sesbania bispinosa]|nr:RIP metalloprotease RseP [Sesbania bispinosa]